MALTDTDRRRMLIATAVTLLALPALWWANTTSDSAAPNVAVVGVEVGTADVPQTAADNPDELGQASPIFLDGPSTEAGAGQQVIAVPAKPAVDGITARATFASTLATTSCIVPGVLRGVRVTVVNVNNGRSIACTTVSTPEDATDVVLATTAFSEIADLTDAPIVVEISR